MPNSIALEHVLHCPYRKYACSLVSWRALKSRLNAFSLAVATCLVNLENSPEERNALAV